MEVDDRTADLYRSTLAWENLKASLDHHKGAKFTEVVKEDELVVEEFNLSVIAGDRDIIDSKVLIKSTTKFEGVYSHMRFQDLNYSTGALLQGKTL